MVCHSLLQWTTFCQTSPPWPLCLGWPNTAWLSFIELDKAVVHVIRLACCLWLLYQSVCPLMPSLSAYHLTSVSLTLDVGYLFMAAPAKRSRCSLPWTWDRFSQPPPLTSDMGYAKWHTHRCHGSSQANHKRLKSVLWLNSWEFPHLHHNCWNNPLTQPTKSPNP